MKTNSKVKKVLLTIICLSLLFSTVLTPNALAAVKRNQDERSFLITVGTDIGPQLFTGVLCWKLTETYTPGGSYIRYTLHDWVTYCGGWSGSAFANMYVNRSTSIKYYDASNNYIKSAQLWAYTGGDIIPPDWIDFRHYEGTDIATINTSSSTATATTALYCPDAMSGSGGTVTVSVYCN